ncbi:MAG: hypothetical protein AB7S83_00565 [Candidatus Methanomethylophilaceae archaeon]|jgi:hypothetical protein
MATVIVDMAFCDKKHKITAKLREDGDLDIHIATDCDLIRRYADRLGKTVSVKDVTDWRGSRVYDPEICSVSSATCLAPSGVINAAWLELGMLSKTKARQIHANCVRFTDEGSDDLIDG